MSETETKTAAQAEKPEEESQAPEETTPQPPKNVDALMQSTARFTHRGWGAFLALKDDLQAIFRKRIRLEIDTRDEASAADLAQAMREASIPAVKQEGTKISTITTFAKLQEVIKHPALLRVDAERLD